MKLLFVNFLALTVIAAAVEATISGEENGLEQSALRYVSQNHLLPFGGPLDLGDVLGIELQSYETLAQSSGLPLGHGYGLPQLYGGFHSLPLGQYGQYGNIGQQDVSALLAAGGLQLQQLPPPSKANGNGVRLGVGSPQSLNLRPIPVSVPQPVTPAPATPQPTPSAPPPPPPVQPALIPAPTHLPSEPVPQPVTFQVSYAPAPTQQAIIPAPAPAPAPGPSPLPVSFPPAAPTLPRAPPNPTPVVGRLGSGSLGYTHLGNGIIALGSGSLGYTPPESANPPPASPPPGSPPPPQFLQTNTAFAGLEAQLGSYGPQQTGYGGMEIAYGGQSLNAAKLNSPNPDLNTNSLGYGDTSARYVGYGTGSVAANAY